MHHAVSLSMLSRCLHAHAPNLPIALLMPRCPPARPPVPAISSTSSRVHARREVVAAKKRMDADDATAEDEAAYHTVHEHNLNTVSGIGNAFGYAGGFTSLLLGEP